MAITAASVNGDDVIQVGADGDTYADLVTAASTLTGIEGDTNLPELLRLVRPLYFPTGVGATFKDALIELGPASGIAIQDREATPADVNDNETGVRFVDSVILLNTSSGSAPAGVATQRPAQFYDAGTEWSSIAKADVAPLQLKNSVMVFCVNDNSDNNALVLCYAVGDGLGGCRIMHDPVTKAGNASGRIFLGIGARITNCDLVNWGRITFNDLPKDRGLQDFSGVRLIGVDSKLDQQGLAVFDSTRFIDNTLTGPLVTNFNGGATKRRSCTCFINMSFLIDGGILSSNTAFGRLQKLDATGVRGAPKMWVNKYDVRVNNPDGTPHSGMEFVGFITKGSGSLTKETALDFSYRFRSYAYNTARYGTVTDDDYDDSGDNLDSRLDNNFSLDGQSKLVSNSDGRTIVSGETDVQLVEFRACEARLGTSTTSITGRQNFSGAKLRGYEYGYFTVDKAATLAYDTESNPDAQRIVYVAMEDPDITESVKANVAAYVSLDNLDNVYDYIRHLEIENADNPLLETISMSGKRIQFPDGTTISQDTAQTDPITVTYAATGPTYTFKDADIAVPTDADKNGINVTATGTIASGIFGMAVILQDMNGNTLSLKTDPVGVILRIEEYDAAGTTLNNTYNDDTNEITDSDGRYARQFPADAQLRIYQKKWGYLPQRTNHDMADGLELDLVLARISHIDIAQDLSAYLGESDSGIEDRIWFDYDTTANKGNWIVGEINTTGEFVKTAALLDHRLSTQDGLAFFAWFNVQDGIADHLSGNSFVWSHDKLEINEDHMQFLRIDGMTGLQSSRLGTPVVMKNGISDYEAPDSNNSQVKFDNAAINISEASLSAISNKTQTQLERDGGKLDDIDTQTSRMTFNDDDEIAAQGGGGGGGSLTSAQSTKLDNIDTRTSDMDSRMTSGRATKIDDIDTKTDDMDGRITDVRAALIDDINTDVEALIARRAFSSTDSARISGTNTNTTTMNNRMTSARAARLDADISSRATSSDIPTVQEITDAVWDELTADIDAASSIGVHLKGLTSGGGGGSGLTADQEAQIDTIESNTNTLNTRFTAARALLLDYLDATVSSRATQTSVGALPSSGDISQAVGAPSTADIQGAIERATGPLQSIKTTVEAIPATAAPIATVVAQAVWDVLASDVTTANSIGKELKDNVLKALQWSRSNPQVTNERLIIRDGMTELGRFVPRTTIPTTDYSGGFEPEP